MNIAEAIKILTVMSKEQVYLLDPDGGDAVLMGIESLKTVEAIRHYPFPNGIIQLPGETKD